MKKNLITFFALLLMAVQGAWATQPKGAFDGAEAHPGSIRVYGWAYDPDHKSESIDVHVYVYSSPDCTQATLAAAFPFTANEYRPDVNAMFSITGNHGYNVYVNLPNLTAGNTYYVRVYAIDKDGNGNPPVDTGTDGRKRPFIAQAPYNVTYDANNGSGAPSVQKKCHGFSLALSSTKPTRTGYTFSKWNTEADGTGTDYSDGATYSENASATLYAQWTAIDYTISYDLDGGSVATANPASYTIESNSITLNNPTREGYTFAGWTGSNGTTPQTTVTIAKGSTDDKTYTANWTENTKTLNEADDNSSWISEKDGEVYDVTLTRKLQTGGWNTFAVPFDATIPTGWTVKELTDASMNGNTLTLSFGNATAIEAGKPYLVKVDAAAVNPTFADVTIKTDISGVSYEAVDFNPTFGTTTLTADKSEILFIGAGNKLYHPSADNQQMKGFRAYFQLKGDALNAQSFAIDFGEGEATAIETVNSAQCTVHSSEAYNLGGQRVGEGYKGIVIVNGKKVIK